MKYRLGVISYSLPRISNQVDGIEPMNLLELARLWIHPSVQNLNYEDRNGKSHSLSIASCAMGKSIKRVKTDWYIKYPNLPKIDAVLLGVMTKDTRVQSTNHPTSKLLERVVVTLMGVVKEKIVETTYHTKILRMLRQDSSTNSLIQIYQLSQILRKFWRTWF